MTMRLATGWLIAWCVAAPAIGAQEPPAGRDSVRAETLRQEIERRFAERVRADLALSDPQMEQLRQHQGNFGTRRRALLRHQRELRLALQQQMRPGVAADADSVRHLNEALRENRGRIFALEQEEDEQLSRFLSPVQVAQYRQLRERLLERVNELRRRAGAGRPGAGQGTPQQRPRPR
jgi:hypothetical protein